MSFIRTKKIHGREYRYLVEGYRENGKMKQRVLQYLGAVSPVKPDTPIIVSKNTITKVGKSGMATVSVSRLLKGKKVSIDWRCRVLPDNEMTE